jgi:hypothetical protein
LPKNAPSFIYEVLYGEPKFLLGRTDSHKQKVWKGIAVDENIPTAALDELDRIGEIELRASCEGSGAERPTFLIFRFRGEESLRKIRAFVEGMNAFKDLKCGAERGNMGFYRVGITAPLWYGKDEEEFVTWWLELPLKVHIVLAAIELLLRDQANVLRG